MKQWDSYTFFGLGMGIMTVGSLYKSDPIFYTQNPKGKEECNEENR